MDINFEDDEKKYIDIKKAGLLGIIANIFLCIIKSTIGFISHSQSMIADSFNSASDIFASFMTFIGNKISSEPKDDDHNFGHGKAEYIFSLFISLAMIFMASKLLFDSIETLINKNYFTYSIFLIIVSIVTIITKFSLYLYVRSKYIKYDNILLKSNYLDHRNDCIVTTFTLISIILGKNGFYYFDGIVGIGIALWILKTGFEILIESYNVLSDRSISNETKDYIEKLIKVHPKILNCYNIYSIPVGYKYFIVFTIVVNGNMSTYESHEIGNHLEKDIEKLPRVYKAIVHVHPEELNTVNYHDNNVKI